MAVFAVIAQSQPGSNADALPTALQSVFPNNYLLVVAGSVWLVAHAGSAVDVSGKLGITDGANGAAVVLEVGSYFGRANPNIWAWIKAKMEATVGG